ncbi:hypothetical protein SUDANB176_06097 [Streptomyces sp. enrichment culture]
MKSFVRAVAMTGAAGALVLLTAPTSQSAPSAASECITASEAKTYGRGEISLCPQSDGSTRVTGYVEDLLPGGLGAPDGYCVGWYIKMGPADGTHGPMACPHFGGPHKPKKEFDYVTTFRLPVTGAVLSRIGV